VGSLSPASATAGGPAFTLTVVGTGFAPNAVVSFNLTNQPTTFVSATQLRVSIPASAIAIAGSPVVIVTNPGTGVSVLATFTVNNPPPSSGTVSPPTLSAGSSALVLAVAGTNFTTGSVVQVNGSARVTTFVSATLLQATLLSSDLAHGGTLVITVNTPPPGGGTTTAIVLPIADYSVSPVAAAAPVPAGQPANFSLAIAPSNGAFTNPITFSIAAGTVLPAGVNVTLPSPVTPGATPTNVTLSITTTARSLVAPSRDFPGPIDTPIEKWFVVLGAIISLAVFGFSRRAKAKPAFNLRSLAPKFVMVVLLGCALGLIACGGTSSPSGGSAQSTNPAGTPAGTYPIGITATSGGVSHDTSVTLTVL